MRFNFDLGINLPAWRSWLLRSAVEFIREHQTGNVASGQGAATASRSQVYLWRYSSPMEDFGTRWVRHRVVGRRGTRIQVEASPSIPELQREQPRRTAGTYWIDQDELQRLGFARAESSHTVFFAQPQRSNRIVTTIEAIQRLGLWFPFSEDDLKQAYVQCARRDHPDAGGSEQRFIQLQEDYQRARVALDEHWWAR